MDKIKQIYNYTFTYADTIRLDVDNKGEIIVYEPLKDTSNKYLNNKRYLLNPPCEAALKEYGELKFCTFKIIKSIPQSCVYALYVDDELKYIGRADNFDKRWGPVNYGKISPRNIYIGGQSTNCKMNNYIYRTCVAGHICYLYVLVSANYKEIEAMLIDKYNQEHPGQLINTQLHSKKYHL